MLNFHKLASIWSLSQDPVDQWKRLFDWIQSEMRFLLVLAVICRFGSHFISLVSQPCGVFLLGIVFSSVIVYAILVLKTEIEGAPFGALRQKKAKQLIVIDWFLFQTAWACSLNIQSDIHLAFFIPLMTATLELDRATVRDLTVLIVLFFVPPLGGVLAAQFLIQWYSGDASALLASLGIPTQSISRDVFGSLLPRAAAWAVIGTPILRHIQTVRQLNSQLEIALKNSADEAELFQTIAAELPYPVFLKSSDARFIWVDKRLAEELAPREDGSPWKPDEMVGLMDQNIFGKADPRVSAYAYSHKRALDDTASRIELYEPHYNSQLAASSSILTTKVRVKDKQGAIIGVLGICRDASQDDDALLFRVAMEGSQHCVFRKNYAGQFVYVNEEFALSTGLERRAILGKTDEELFGERGLRYREEDLALMRKPKGDVYRNRQQHPFGMYSQELRWVEVRKIASFDSQGNAYGIQGVFWDVQVGADENERFINVFLHDAPKPIMLIEDNYTQPLLGEAKTILDSKGIIDSELANDRLNAFASLVQEQVGLIRSAANFVHSQYICFGMLSTRWMSLQHFESDKKFYLKETIESIAQHIRVGSACYGVVTDYSSLDRLWFLGKASALRNVFWILVDNAVKASKRMQRQLEERWKLDNPNQPVTKIPVDAIRVPPPTASFDYSDGMLTLIVRDFGDGLAPEKMRLLNTIDPSQTRSSRFGWLIVSYLAKQLNGHRSIAAAADGRGSVVKFAIRAEQLEPPRTVNYDSFL